jgi:branched-chain amino acid transport system ATP-binding protein
MSELLQVRGLVKRFGGLLATDHVDLDVHRGEIHAVIGPNGAGKTTLIAQLQGELHADAGSIRFEGREMSGTPPWRRSLAGVARSFQITSIIAPFTALDNVALAVQAHAGHSFRFWKAARGDTALRDPARSALARVGLADRADVPAGVLSHGEQRQLELAMAIATAPRLLLLDEPMAGMGKEDSGRMVDLIASLKQDHGILLVEHDMDAVFALADRISVLVYGKVIASGTPEAIRRDQAVISAYLGDEAA